MRASSSSCTLMPILSMAAPSSSRSISPEPSVSSSANTSSARSHSSASVRFSPSICTMPFLALSQRDSSVPVYMLVTRACHEGKSIPTSSPLPWSMPASSSIASASSSLTVTPSFSIASRSSSMSILPLPSESNSLKISRHLLGSSNSRSTLFPSFFLSANPACFQVLCLSLELYILSTICSNSSSPIDELPSTSSSSSMCCSSLSVSTTLSDSIASFSSLKSISPLPSSSYCLNSALARSLSSLSDRLVPSSRSSAALAFFHPLSPTLPM
mmetsp:Transcript_10269/g.24909  ORF Transcript_10269/g.24909 Transcript_10269/m.24909 type:complete len:271 (+) Transcript_10269:758-1570(+)